MDIHARAPSARLALPILLAATALFTPHVRAEDGQRSVTLGEVSATAARERPGVHDLMRGAAQSELATLSIKEVPKRRVILSLALVQMETRPVSPTGPGARSSVDCVVSATLRTAKDGVLIAMLNGHARAEGGGPVDVLESQAIRGAVHGAIDRIPVAIK